MNLHKWKKTAAIILAVALALPTVSYANAEETPVQEETALPVENSEPVSEPETQPQSIVVETEPLEELETQPASSEPETEQPLETETQPPGSEPETELLLETETQPVSSESETEDFSDSTETETSQPEETEDFTDNPVSESVKAVQALIEELPGVEELSAMSIEDQQEVYERLQTAYDAYSVLSDEEKAFITGAEIFETLFGFFNSGISILADEVVNGITYLDADGIQQTADNVTVVAGDSTTWESGWYVVNIDVVMGSRVTVNGEVYLILADGCTLNAGNGGINVDENQSLTIYGQSGGTGRLTATGGQLQAGIGSDFDGNGGSITINGGNVTATGNNGGAGIGSGSAARIYGGSGNGNGGSITINGGNVTATGNNGGAGIGGGVMCSGGSITINGGTINASSGTHGAGIGGGDNGSGGSITINGGTINANSGTYGAGIGGGNGRSGGSITINGGNVTAIGGYSAAGIGGGFMGGGGDISISGGTVNASGGNSGAGIGGGFMGGGGDISISGGTVNASGGNNGAGIGGGNNGSGGTFSTGENGNAFIIADSISDQSGKESSWSGVIVEGNSGQVYKDTTIQNDAEIPADTTLTVPEGVTLTIPENVTLTNNGTILNYGTIIGTVSGNPPQNFAPTPTVTVDTSKTTASSVTINSLERQDIYGNAEYSLDGNDWQESNVFTQLHSAGYGGNYTVYARYKGNDSYGQSKSGTISASTGSANYTITIPAEPLEAGNTSSKAEIKPADNFDVGYGGQAIVKIKENSGVSADGKVTLTRTGEGNRITCPLLLDGTVFTDITQPIAAFGTKDSSVNISFAEPTEDIVPAGAYTGTVTFEITYNEQ